MKFFNRATRTMLPVVVFLLLLGMSIGCWVLFRFVLDDAQNRILEPKHYDMQVVTAEDYRQLSDPTVRNVTLADGSTLTKAAAWDDIVPAGYKPTATKAQYVLVKTKGTAHVIPYLEPYLVMFSFLAGCGVLASVWNLKTMQE
jgi:hypothetical protein